MVIELSKYMLIRSNIAELVTYLLGYIVSNAFIMAENILHPLLNYMSITCGKNEPVIILTNAWIVTPVSLFSVLNDSN